MPHAAVVAWAGLALQAATAVVDAAAAVTGTAVAQPGSRDTQEA